MPEIRLLGGKRSEAEFQRIYDDAHKAGIAAGQAAMPQSICVTQHANPLNDNSEVTRRWIVPEGVCGFAWISFRGNTSWAAWTRKHKISDTDYPRGRIIWVRQFGQSYERKVAYAKAFADVLVANGINAYSAGRLD